MFQQNYKNKYLKYKSKYLDLKYGGAFDLNLLTKDEQDYYNNYLTSSDRGTYGPRFILKNKLEQELNEFKNNLKKILYNNLKTIDKNDKYDIIEKKLLQNARHDNDRIKNIEKQLLKIGIEDKLLKNNKTNYKNYLFIKGDDKLVDIEIDRQTIVFLHNHEYR
jgi:hypothetical protein